MIETITLTNNPASTDAGWKFDKVINMKEMFNRCESATSIIFPKYTNLNKVTNMVSLFCHNLLIPVTGSGSFTDIFSRWDISTNNEIEFIANPGGGYGDDTPNRVVQGNSAQLKKLKSNEFSTYTTNVKVEIGSKNGNFSLEQQRLKRTIVNQ